MLGWGNTPPQDSIEKSILALNKRLENQAAATPVEESQSYHNECDTCHELFWTTDGMCNKCPACIEQRMTGLVAKIGRLQEMNMDRGERIDALKADVWEAKARVKTLETEIAEKPA